MKYDAIVVGARAAGSSTAMLLARKGYRVLAVDRATFPSDTLSTHYLQSPGMARLINWGLAGRLEGVADPIQRLTFDMGELVLSRVRRQRAQPELWPAPDHSRQDAGRRRRGGGRRGPRGFQRIGVPG